MVSARMLAVIFTASQACLLFAASSGQASEQPAMPLGAADAAAETCGGGGGAECSLASAAQETRSTPQPHADSVDTVELLQHRRSPVESQESSSPRGPASHGLTPAAVLALMEQLKSPSSTGSAPGASRGALLKEVGALNRTLNGSSRFALDALGLFRGLDEAPADKAGQSKSWCEQYPTLCGHPFYCGSMPLTLMEIFKMMVEHVATDDGHTNVRTWCLAPMYDKSIAKHCIAEPNLEENAHLLFEQQVGVGVGILDASYCFLEGHCVNWGVGPHTNMQEAEHQCDMKYGHHEWTSTAILKPPMDFSASIDEGFKNRQLSSWFGKLACAMGNFHCDVIYCQRTYCSMPIYQQMFSHFLVEYGYLKNPWSW